MNRALPRLSENTQRVGFVHIDRGSIFFCDAHHGGEVNDITRHTEHAVQNDEFTRLGREALQPTPKSVRRVVRKRNGLRARHPTAVNDARVIFPIAQNKVIRFQKRCQRAFIGEKSGRK